DLQRPTISGAVDHEVDRPDLVRVGGNQVAGHARPSPSPARPGRQTQALVAPKPLHPLAITGPALPAQQRVDAPVAVAGMAPGKQPQPLAQHQLVGERPAPVALRRAMLTRKPASSALGNPETTLQVRDRPAPPLRAHQFPRATSLSMSLSSSF